MEEYILQTHLDSDWQKRLNQWRHEYIVNIISMQCAGDHTTILLTRVKKK